jgi:tetratricopeptide (TPR) repeat protein
MVSGENMSSCWTCGSSVDGYHYTCSSCNSIIQNQTNEINYGFNNLIRAQKNEFDQLKNVINSNFSGIASILVWGVQELKWEIQQQSNLLKSINNTLITPSQTKANELRIMGEELRRRGVIDQAERFFLESLEMNPLDYRTYIGLAQTYLIINKFYQAKLLLEKSLPHAPKDEIDYKSYSYKLIGHIYSCEENYDLAISCLKQSINLSPNYYDCYYDCAQYYAKEKDAQNSINLLKRAISGNPSFWYLAQNDFSFEPIKNELKKLLSDFFITQCNKVNSIINQTENIFSDISKSTLLERNIRESFKESCENIKNKLKEADNKIGLSKILLLQKEYPSSIKAEYIANEGLLLANTTLNLANQLKNNYKKFIENKQKQTNSFIVGIFIGISFISCFILCCCFPTSFSMFVNFVNANFEWANEENALCFIGAILTLLLLVLVIASFCVPGLIIAISIITILKMLRKSPSLKLKKKMFQFVNIFLCISLIFGIIYWACFGFGTKQKLETDNNEKNIKINNFNAKQELPKNFPEDIPLYPRAKMVEIHGDKEDFITVFTTIAPVKDVVAYYAINLKTLGWKIETSQVSEIIFEKGNRSGNISARKDKSQTLILIRYKMKKN